MWQKILGNRVGNFIIEIHEKKMMLLTLLLVPFFGIFLVLADIFNNAGSFLRARRVSAVAIEKETAITDDDSASNDALASSHSEIVFNASSAVRPNEALVTEKRVRVTALSVSIINLIVSLIVFILFDFSSNQFQFVQEHHEISSFHIYLGVDGLSIYFVLLTTIITPIALLSNWTSITENIKSYVIIVLLLETLLLAVFLVLDILLFYVFFESILPPLFILIGIFGSSNKVRASFYLFLYTLGGSLFLLLSILAMSSLMGTTDFDALSKTNFNYFTQLFLFYGIFIAFAVKTPTIFLNTWLLKAHVESPLAGSIILAGIKS